MRDLFRRQVLFFGGKGGVGKTTCAAATALVASRSGRRVLLVSTDPAHSTSDIFGRPFAATEREILPKLTGIEIDASSEARRYVADVKRRVTALFTAESSAKALEQIDIAATMPGIEEAALFERVTDIITSQSGDYDLIVVDTAPTGHTLQLFRTPLAMAGWLRALAESRRRMLPADRVESDEIVRSLTARIDKLDRLRARLTSHSATAFVLVLVPERLPVDETARAAAQLRDAGVQVGAIVVNRVLPADAAGEFIEARRRQQRLYLDEIDARFSTDRRVWVTERCADVKSVADLEEVGAMLFAVEV